MELVKVGALHCVRIRQKIVHYENDDKKIAAVVYEYQVDNDGTYGEIQFNLVEKTAKVLFFAENVSQDTKDITDQAIQSILRYYIEDMPKKALIALHTEPLTD